MQQTEKVAVVDMYSNISHITFPLKPFTPWGNSFVNIISAAIEEINK